MKILLALTVLFLALTGTAAASCTSPNGGIGSTARPTSNVTTPRT